MSKMHAVNKNEDPEDWVQSPHIEGAIRDGVFTDCHIITTRVTSIESEVTCHRCRKIADDARSD